MLCILGSISIGGLGGLFTAQEIPNWYASLKKPSFNPPNYLFGPVWTLLYFLMGISFYLILKEKKSNSHKTQSIISFVIQITLNFFWSFIFFKNLSCHNLKLTLGFVIGINSIYGFLHCSQFMQAIGIYQFL